MDSLSYQKHYALAHPEQIKAKSRRDGLRRFHSMTVEQYNEMFAYQTGKCAICHKHQSCFKRRLAVDHNHTTGKIRGLLCPLCNTNLAVLEDKTFCVSASLYLGEVK